MFYGTNVYSFRNQFEIRSSLFGDSLINITTFTRGVNLLRILFQRMSIYKSYQFTRGVCLQEEIWY